MQVEWRRTPIDSPPVDDQGEPELIERLRSEIVAGGPITFARFMERALYEPGLGYYATQTDRPTRSGDFLTAPELHPIFGHVLARELDRMWHRLGRPAQFTLREYGAGEGTLFLAVLDGLTRGGSGLARAIGYQPVDLPKQQEKIAERVADTGHSHLVAGYEAGTQFTGCVIANEFADALPVHRVEMREGRLMELYVGWSDGRFVDVAGEPSTDRLAAWFDDGGVALADGQRAEVNLAMVDWAADVAGDLELGFVLTMDYGGSTAELCTPHRSSGTVRAFRGQHVSSDVLAAVGHQDLTAHVDFDALERAARAAGLEVLSRTRQAEFLLAAGLEQEYATARSEADADWDLATALRGAVRRLLDPRALGGYIVLKLGKGISS